MPKHQQADLLLCGYLRVGWCYLDLAAQALALPVCLFGVSVICTPKTSSTLAMVS
ncbi:hypothetical protein HMPREF9371_0889 [Neisseria shayeganii 871]|uniref:Uncharacterized protein n=1 Tax=Neisseria shayeganii 871 TaxID=1032488 RepID=G4CH00_9NEIS|nr:hypothetical protein HMPREF9371_0889 [Neisseria shayeganii 871]